jgi:hypothetical protein
MWPGLPTATNTARPTESFSTNRKLTSRDSCPLSAVLVRPVRVAYIRILAAWRCCGSSDMTARPRLAGERRTLVAGVLCSWQAETRYGRG